MWIQNKTKEQILEESYDILFDAYVEGFLYGASETKISEKAIDEAMYSAVEQIGIDRINKAISKKIADRTTIERISEYYDEYSSNEIQRVLETEYHRIFNEGSQYGATESGLKYKTWKTMGDDKVRDTHIPIEGKKIKIGEKFTAGDGDRAMFPGGFSNAQNNVNCRCIVEYS